MALGETMQLEQHNIDDIAKNTRSNDISYF